MRARFPRRTPRQTTTTRRTHIRMQPADFLDCECQTVWIRQGPPAGNESEETHKPHEKIVEPPTSFHCCHIALQGLVQGHKMCERFSHSLLRCQLGAFCNE